MRAIVPDSPCSLKAPKTFDVLVEKFEAYFSSNDLLAALIVAFSVPVLINE